MRVPLPLGLIGTEDLPRTKRELVNCYNNGQDNIVQRPGIASLSNPGGIARGGFTWNGGLYKVYSQQLKKITDVITGATEDIGIIAGSSVIRTAIGFNDAVIVVKGGNIYTLSKSINQVDVVSVIDDGGGIARFSHFGTAPSVGNTVTLSGFATVSYNVTGIVSALVNNSTTATDVTDNAFVALFTHTGTSPAIGETVTTSGFTEPSYNTTGIVSSSSLTTFEITGVAYVDDQSGSFIAASTFQIDSLSFVIDDSGSFTLVLADISSNANFVPCDDVTHIDGRFVYIPTSGEPAFFSDVGIAGSVQPLSFFDAEELPDKNNAVFNGKNTLYICGEDSIELFKNVGGTSNVFLRISGSRILNGFISGLLEYNNTFLFIGREKGQDLGIYAIASGVAPKISNEAIDIILHTYSIKELGQVVVGRFKHNGNDIATFTLARHSFGFFAGNWFLLETIENETRRPWSAGFITHFEGSYYTAFEGRLGKLEAVNTDYGFKFPRILKTAIEQEDGDDFSFQSLELGLSQGFNKKAGSVGLRTTDDNVIYGDYTFETTSAIGGYSKNLSWNYPGGLGTYPGFLGVELYTVEDIVFNIDKIILK